MLEAVLLMNKLVDILGQRLSKVYHLGHLRRVGQPGCKDVLPWVDPESFEVFDMLAHDVFSPRVLFLLGLDQLGLFLKGTDRLLQVLVDEA